MCIRDRDFTSHNIASDYNVFWDLSGSLTICVERATGRRYSLREWRELGYDAHTLIADPKFRDLFTRDFSLEEGSPAISLGFKPIDLPSVGPAGLYL